MESSPGEPSVTPKPIPTSPTGEAPTPPLHDPATAPGREIHAGRSRSAGSRDALCAVGAAIAYLAIQVLVVRLRPTNAVVYSALSLVSLVTTLAYTVALTRSLRSSNSQILTLVISAAIVLPFMSLPFLHLASPGQIAAARQVFRVYGTVFQAAPGLLGILMISLAVGVGVVLSRMVREIKILLPIAVVLALVDLYVVFGGGLVAQAESGRAPAAQTAMKMLTVSLLPRAPASLNAPQPLAVGFADFLFIALFFACFVRFHVPARRTFVLLCSILCLYMVVVIVGSIDLPALLPIAIVIVGSHLDAFRYKREEAFAMLYAGLLVAAILAGLVYMSHRS